ncbi:HTH tetR-type domain-containing protein [Mycobacterium sp. smrl_JER01]
MSKSSFYYIFESKEELFDFVVTESVAKLAAAIPVPAAEEFAAGDFWARAEALLAAFAHTAAQDATLLDVGRMFYRAAPDTARSPVTATHVRAHTWVRDVLAVGRRRGAVRDDLPEDLQSDLAFGVLQIFDRWSVNHLDELDNARTAALTAAQLAALRRLLAP